MGGFLCATLLTAIGSMFVWLALKVRAQRAFGIYGMGMFVKTIVGIAMCVVAVKLTNIDPLGFMLTLGFYVCISYPVTAIVLTHKMK